MSTPSADRGCLLRGFQAFPKVAFLFFVAACVPPASPATAIEPEPNVPASAGDPGPRSFADRSGVLDTQAGLTLRVHCDLGAVRVLPLEPGAAPAVRYTLHLETDARPPLAQRLLAHYSLVARSTARGVEIVGSLPPEMARSSSQFWVQFEITVPGNYNLQVNTGGGDIETQDIGGIALLSTQGGNIRAGRIGFHSGSSAVPGRLVARLHTQGGHIHVLDVAGNLNAFTVGGHIDAGTISGDATLHSGGGHIRVGKIGGRGDLETDGGNITVGQANNVVAVRTGGGQIDFGEVRGSVRAQTGGGGIRIIYVSGPLEVESSAGSICLTRVAGQVQAATAGGTIRAWINPEVASSGGPLRLAGASQLTSGNGDIVVFLPRNLAANIDAWVASGGGQGIEADPSLALNFENVSASSGPVHAVAALNGGGAPLKLRTNSGKIRLRFLDSEVALHEALVREQRERLMEHLSNVPFTPPPFRAGQEWQPPEPSKSEEDSIDSLLNRMQEAFTGRIRQDPEEFKRRLISPTCPVYPEIAKRTGLQGIVRLQVHATKDGRVEVDKVLEGSPTLANAAIAAASQWRVKPVLLRGRPVEVVSVVSFNFQLH